MFDRFEDAALFDELCGCGNPECPVSRSAAIAKKLYLGEAITPEEGRELAEGFAGAVMTGKALSLELRFAAAALQALASGEGEQPQAEQPAPPRPQPRQPRRNPFSGI